MIRKFSEDELVRLKHPTEDYSFQLALAVCIPVALVIFFTTFLSDSIFLILLVLIIGAIWLVHAMAKAYLVGNSIRVSKKNFPEIHKIIDEVKYTLDYDKEIQVFVIDEGNVNAFLAKFFKIKYIILNSELVEDMLNEKTIFQLKWIIARFVGALKMKHLRLDIFRVVLEGIEKLKVFNLLIYPYERAVQLTGDNIGLLVSNNLSESIHTFDKFLVGNTLAERVNLSGVLEQGRETNRSIIASMVRLFSAHPHVIDRYLNLLAIGKQCFPRQYAAYISELGMGDRIEMKFTLPDCYKNIEAIQNLELNPRVRPPLQISKRNTEIQKKIKISRKGKY